MGIRRWEDARRDKNLFAGEKSESQKRQKLTGCGLWSPRRETTVMHQRIFMYYTPTYTELTRFSRSLYTSFIVRLEKAILFVNPCVSIIYVCNNTCRTVAFYFFYFLFYARVVHCIDNVSFVIIIL